MRILACLALLACSGCANKYLAVKGAPTATLVFSSSAPANDGVMVQAFADADCGRSKAGTRVVYFYKDLFDDRAGTAKPATAGRDFVFTFRSRSDTGTVATFCRLTRSFVPEADATYRAHFVSSQEQCDVKVSRLTSDASADREASPVTVTIVDPVCFNDFDG